jgi:transcription elongation factor GreA
MTSRAWDALVAEIGHVADDVVGEPAEDPGLIRLRVAGAERRLATLREVAEDRDVLDEPGLAVIGRRVTLREPDGEQETYALVFPGDGDPDQGWISADSPLGAAVLGGRAGDEVVVDAPAGRRPVKIVAVDG